MAGHVRKLESGRWMARLPLGGRGRYRSRTFVRKLDAQNWLDAQNVARNRGEWIDPKAAGETFYSVADTWLASRRGKAASTQARDESVVRNLILPYLGAVELRHISPEVLDEWVHHLDEVEEKAPATTRKAFQLAGQVLERAVATRRLSANPAKVKDAIELPRIDEDEMRFLSVEEVHRLAETIGERYRALILAAAYSGLRWGELAGLRRRNLNLDGGKITVVETLSEVSGHLHHKEPKSKASIRTVAIPAGIVSTLEDHLGRWPAIGAAAVFTGPDGGLLRRSAFRSRIWLPAVRSSVSEPLRFHDLRHSHVAILVAQGAHPKTIQARLGHASISTTLDRYGHLFDGLDQAAADALDGVFAEAVKHSGSTQRLGSVSEIGPGRR